MSLGHFVYVYGTLRPGGKETHKVPGVMYDMGHYPGIRVMSPEAGKFVTCEKLEVTPTRLMQLDQYEGYRPSDPQRSLYLRVPYLDGFIYEYNQSLEDRKTIESGDWLEYRGQERGSAAR